MVLVPDLVFKDHIVYLGNHGLTVIKVDEGIYAECPCGAYIMIYEHV